jgi:tetratricopeptide (TPR) repeat protein
MASAPNAISPPSTTHPNTASTRKVRPPPSASAAICQPPLICRFTHVSNTRCGFRAPDLSVTLGTPNACNSCHTEQQPQWAAGKVGHWYPQADPGNQQYAEAFAAANLGFPGANAGLLTVIGDATQPAIARASAFARSSASRDQQTFSALVDGLYDDNEIVRQAAVEAVARVAPNMSIQALPPLLAGPIRGLRIAAARALAGANKGELKPEHRAAFKQALDEYIAAQLFSADRPKSLTNLGALYSERGDASQAEVYFRQAIALDLLPQRWLIWPVCTRAKDKNPVPNGCYAKAWRAHRKSRPCTIRWASP